MWSASHHPRKLLANPVFKLQHRVGVLRGSWYSRDSGVALSNAPPSKRLSTCSLGMRGNLRYGHRDPVACYPGIDGFRMENLLQPQLLGPAVVALITAVGSYFLIIQKTRKELADETKRALEAFREKAEVAEANERLAFRAEQRAEMQELRQKIQVCETDKADMIVKLAGAQAKITILEARVCLLENGASQH